LRRAAVSRLILAGLLGGLAILLSGCSVFSSPQNTFSPVGEVAHDQKMWFLWAMWPALAIMLGVELGLVFIILRFRKRPGHEELPKQIHGNNAIEITWTILPAILLMFFVPVVIYGIVKFADTPKDSLEVQVNAFRFGWYFGYQAPDGSVVESTPSSTADLGEPLMLPLGRSVGLHLNSADVIHSFWVPRLGGKTDVVPGRNNTMWLRGEELGLYSGQCAEFCGLSHAYMRFNVKVVTQEEYDAYIASLVAARDGNADGDLVNAGADGGD
jgi:cytochrome c oxidase subunit 2